MVTTNKSLVEPPFNNTSGTLPNGNAYTSWDSPVNYNMTTLDNALGSTTAINVAGVTTPQTFTLAQYQSLMIDFTGVLSQDVVYSVPASVGGFWIISNSCTANFNLSISYNVGTVKIPKGGQYLVFVDTTTSPYINLLQISGLATNAGNPNGVLAGNSTAPASVVWDTTNNWLWVCTTSGPPSTAVWSLPTGSLKYNQQTLVVTTGNAAWDMTLGPNALLNLTGATTLTNPTNQAIGDQGVLTTVEDGTGGRTLAFGTSYILPDGSAPIINLAANSRTAFDFTVIAAPGVGSVVLTPHGTRLGPHVIIEDQKSSGTAAQSLTGATDNQRNLTTLVQNYGGLATLSSNRFTLPAGTYFMTFWTAILGPNQQAGAHFRASVFNFTDTALAIQGNTISTGVHFDVSGSTDLCIISNGSGTLTTTGAKTFELRTYANVAANGGVALNTGSIEVYSHVEITKL